MALPGGRGLWTAPRRATGRPLARRGLRGRLMQVRRNYTDGTEKVPKGKGVRSVPMTPGRRRPCVPQGARLPQRRRRSGLLLTHRSPPGPLQPAAPALPGDQESGAAADSIPRSAPALRMMAITVLNGYVVQSFMWHQHFSTTARYLHHKPRREDAARLHAALANLRWRKPLRPSKGRVERRAWEAVA